MKMTVVNTRSIIVFVTRDKRALPVSPPTTPPMTIYGSIVKSSSVKPVVTLVVIIEDSWEKKMIKSEFILDSFAVIEKQSDRIATLNGPPPIPRKAAMSPSVNPIIKMMGAFSNVNVRHTYFFF